MHKNKKLFKHQVLITIITVLAVVISMIGGSYAIFSSTSKADEYNVLKVGNLEISYVDDEDGYGDILSLNGAFPITDDEGEKLTPYRFSIMNTGTITADFKIKILYDEAIIEEDNCSDNLLKQKYIKYKFDNEEAKLLSDKEENEYIIYEAKGLLPGNSEIHEIRLWIDENATNDILGKHFHGKVVVESIQTGIEVSQSYEIGTSVTLKDGSKWRVLENSTANNNKVTLLSDYNLNSDGSYNTTCGKNINNNTICSPMAFDTKDNRLTANNSYCLTPETGCNIYSSNDSTVSQDSTVKTWLESTYLPIVKESLENNGGTTEDLTVTLPTMEQIAQADNQTFNQTQLTFSKDWLTTTTYWTKTASTMNTSYVWNVVGEHSNSYVEYANSSTTVGVRPVITVLKSNIK